MPPVDVIIVGVGPTGGVLAGLLAQRGIRVAAFDQLPDLYPLPRAIGLDHEVMRLIQELGIAERVLRHTAPYRPSEYRGVSGQLIKRLDTNPPPYRLGWAPNYVFDQPAFEREIRTRLLELEHVDVHYSAEVTTFGETPDRVWADVTFADGRSERYSARYLIACDGGSSPIRKTLGIQLEDLDFDEPWLVVDAIVPDEKLAHLPQTQVQYCSPDRPSTFVVGPGNHRRWEVMLLPGDSLSPEFPAEELWPLLSRWVKPDEVELWRAAAYRFHGLVADRWRVGRVLLAGDSAHMTPPFMAQGMVQGIRDAQNLAWKLARVLAGDSPEDLLDSYETERIPHVKTTTRTAIDLGNVICERNLTAALARDARFLAEHDGEIRTAIRQNMIPNLAGGIIAIDSPGAGEPFPQPLVRQPDGTTVLLDDLTGPAVRLVARDAIGASEAAQFAAVLAGLGGRQVSLTVGSSAPDVIVAPETGTVASAWFEAHGTKYAVVRPDHYVFGTAPDVAGTLLLLQRLRAHLLTEPSP